MESKSVDVMNIDGVSKEFTIYQIPAIGMKSFLDKYNEHSRLSGHELLSLLSQSGVDINQVDDHEQLARLENEIILFNTEFIRDRKRLRIPTFKSKFVPQGYANADPFIASIISSGMATYLQLKNELSLEEAFTLWEISTTNKINEMKAVES